MEVSAAMQFRALNDWLAVCIDIGATVCTVAPSIVFFVHTLAPILLSPLGLPPFLRGYVVLVPRIAVRHKAQLAALAGFSTCPALNCVTPTILRRSKFVKISPCDTPTCARE